MPESKVKKKFDLLKVYGKSGLVYIFDTNGFHRQASVDTGYDLNSHRDLISVYLNSNKR